MCADKQKQTHLICSFCWFNKFQIPRSWRRLTLFTMSALLVHLASAVSKLLSLLACKCLAFLLRHVFPLLSSVWIQAYFHPSLLSGNLYFSHFTPPLPLDLSCQVSECVSHKKSCFSLSVTNNSPLTWVLWFLSCSLWVIVCCCTPTKHHPAYVTDTLFLIFIVTL